MVFWKKLFAKFKLFFHLMQSVGFKISGVLQGIVLKINIPFPGKGKKIVLTYGNTNGGQN